MACEASHEYNVYALSHPASSAPAPLVQLLSMSMSLVLCLSCRNLTRELLDYLAVCDGEFKPDLTAKIATLIQRYAPDKRWHIDSLLQVQNECDVMVSLCSSL